MSLMLLGILNSQAAGGGDSYWFCSIGGSGNDYSEKLVVDSENNIILIGRGGADVVGSEDGLIYKLDTNGAVQWGKLLGQSGNDAFTDVSSDSSNNYFVNGYTQSGNNGGYDWLAAKYNSSGALQWQKSIGGTQNDQGGGIATDSSGNAYLAGTARDPGRIGYGAPDGALVKINTAGATQWQRWRGGYSGASGGFVSVDSSGNAYLTWNDYGNYYKPHIVKYNSSGSIVWERSIGGTRTIEFMDTAVSPSGTVYCVGTHYDTNSNRSVIVSTWDSSGTYRWTKLYGNVGGYDVGMSIALDSEENVYVSGMTDGGVGGQYKVLLLKYNSSGVLQFQRSFGTAQQMSGEGIHIDINDNIIINARLDGGGGAGGGDFFVLKLPNDGSLTGSYVLNSRTYDYAVLSLSEYSDTLYPSTGGGDSGGGGLGNQTSSKTTSTPSATQFILTI